MGYSEKYIKKVSDLSGFQPTIYHFTCSVVFLGFFIPKILYTNPKASFTIMSRSYIQFYLKPKGILLFPLIVLALSGCAPEFLEPEAVTEPARTEEPIQIVAPEEPLTPNDTVPEGQTATFDPSLVGDEPLSVKPEPVTEPAVPDWKQRYEDLQQEFAQKLVAPKVGQPVRIQLASGRQQQGILAGITETDLALTISQGTISYPKEALHSRSVKDFYGPEFADYHALQQATVEYNAWLRTQPRAMPQVVSTTRTPSTSPEPAPVRSEPKRSTEERIPMFPIPPELLGR